ncbi:MAG: hypothetical protein ACK5O2_16670 [Microthrixaceae bacterium]
MGTTTVRLDDDDRRILDRLAQDYGGRSSAIRHAIRRLAADQQRREALGALLEAWDADLGTVDEADVAAMADRYGL